MYMKILLGDIMYRKNISVRQLSLMAGIPKSTISNIMNERYSPTLENLEKIAIALEVKISDLYESEYK
jgi:DNA-binding Xre family transcriptional regulator